MKNRLDSLLLLVSLYSLPSLAGVNLDILGVKAISATQADVNYRFTSYDPPYVGHLPSLQVYLNPGGTGACDAMVELSTIEYTMTNGLKNTLTSTNVQQQGEKPTYGDKLIWLRGPKSISGYCGPGSYPMNCMGGYFNACTHYPENNLETMNSLFHMVNGLNFTQGRYTSALPGATAPLGGTKVTYTTTFKICAYNFGVGHDNTVRDDCSKTVVKDTVIQGLENCNISADDIDLGVVGKGAGDLAGSTDVFVDCPAPVRLRASILSSDPLKSSSGTVNMTSWFSKKGMECSNKSCYQIDYYSSVDRDMRVNVAATLNGASPDVYTGSVVFLLQAY
ncbi:MAG: hypothetical protein ACQEWL_10740 [Pseudomonadota bacterium]|uniref:hypothetical protein n=1 Tax=Providencia stuartii TaxID=588 RepID=UPI00300C563C